MTCRKSDCNPDHSPRSSSRNDRYDVAVIGAGPGGALSARDCAAFGLKTIVLEEDPEPGEPLHCAECMSSYAAVNAKLDLPDRIVARKVRGVRVIFPGGAAKCVIEDGYVLDKPAFEQWLVNDARRRGAEIRLSAKVIGMRRSGDRWTVDTTCGRIHSSLIIDASGVAAVSTRLLRLNGNFQYTVGVQFAIESVDTDGFIDFYLWPGLAPDGYIWVIPRADNFSNVGLISSCNRRLREQLDQFLRIRGYESHPVLRKFGGKIPSSGPSEHIAEEGLLMVGDAAGLTSPLFEGGTHLALKSGQIAARIANRAVAAADFSRIRLMQHRKACLTEFPDYALIIKGRRRLYNFSDAELDTIAGYIPDVITEFPRRDKIRSGIRVLFRHPELILKGMIPMLRAIELSRSRNYGW